jgi:hypothetical protein
MWNLGRVFNPICQVHFAGFSSNTYALQKAGWQLSFERMINMDGVRLALKYEPARIYAITSPVPMREFHQGTGYECPVAFNVAMIGNDVRFQIMPMRAAGSWAPFDATPEFVDSHEMRFEDLIPFRPISLDAPEIVIAQDNAPAMLEAILKMQDPKQAEIRARQRKEAWLMGEGLKEPKAGMDPRRDIRAQIISVAA